MPKNKARTFRQEFLKPGFYRIGGEMRQFSKADLGSYKAGTNRLLHSGFKVPVLASHAKPGSSDGAPVPAAKADARKGCGWLKKVSQAANGALSHVVEITDPTAADGIDNGSIKFTSPEFQKGYISGDGRSFGDVIRHVALTAAPRTQNQGEIIACSEDEGGGEIFSFSEADYLGTDESEAAIKFAEGFPPKKPAPEADPAMDNPETTPDAGVVEPVVDDADVAPETTPADEQPTAEVDVEVDGNAGPDIMNLVPQIVEKTGAIIPDGTDPSTPEGMMIVLTAIINAAPAAEDTEQIQLDEEPAAVGTFSDEDDPRLVAMSEEVEKLKTQARSKATEASRAKLSATLTDPSIPPALCKFLKGHATRVAFAEGGEEEPSFSTQEVVAIIKQTIPRAMMDFSEDLEAEHPDGEAAFNNDGSPFSEVDAPAMSQAEAAQHVASTNKNIRPHTERWQSDLHGTGPAGAVKTPEAAPAKSSGRGKRTK